jgi:hypothetical protein
MVEQGGTYPAVNAAVLGHDLGVVGLQDQQGGENPHCATTKGGHDGVHLRQLRRQVQLPYEVAVRRPCASPNRPTDQSNEKTQISSLVHL